jgi:hypothetical protein
MTTAIDVERLFKDLVNYCGTAPFGFIIAAMADVEQAWEQENYDRIIEWAVQEGFNLEDYYV